MERTGFDRGVLLFFRIAMGWTFLYAGLSQLTDPHFTVSAFLSGTKTFHAVFAWFGTPAIAPYATFLVEWGHTLIGLSLITGCFVRLSALFGIALMIVYYFAHMDWPYIESHVNFIMDYHLVYAVVLFVLMQKGAGLVYGLDAWLETLPVVESHRTLKACLG